MNSPSASAKRASWFTAWRTHGVALLWVAGMALCLAAPALQAGLWEPMELRDMDARVRRVAGMPLGESVRRFGTIVASARRGGTIDLAPPPRTTPKGGNKDPLGDQPLPGPGRTLAYEWTTPSRAAAVEIAGVATAVTSPKDAGADAPQPLVAATTAVRDARAPLVAWAVLAAMLTYALGCLLASPRIGLLASLIIMGMPLWSLSARQLAGDGATLCGALILVCGAVMAAQRRSWPMRALGGALALGGWWWCLRGGGTLLGVLPPLLGALAYAVSMACHRPYRRGAAVAAVATATLLVATVAITASQTHDARPPTPGTRQWFGTSFVPTNQPSPWLGATWGTQPQPNASAASAFEHIAFGIWPWSALALIALLSLAISATTSANPAPTPGAGANHASSTHLLVTWAGASWLAMALWQLNVGGIAVYGGTAALALASAVWLHSRAASAPRAKGGELVATAVLLAAALGALAKDGATTRQIFANLDAVIQLSGRGAPTGYEVPSRGPLGLPYAAWFAGIGALAALATAPSFVTRLRPYATRCAAAAALLVAIAVNWLIYPRLDAQLSSKPLFAMARVERKPGDRLLAVADVGYTPHYYDDQPWQQLGSVNDVVAALRSPHRAFAIAGRKRDVCAIHRGMKGAPYFVFEDDNPQLALISNQPSTLGASANPLADVIARTAPAALTDGSAQTPPAPIVFDDKLELIGWRVPKSIHRGTAFDMTLYFRVIAPVGGSWSVFGHYDGPGKARFGSDHPPTDGLCPTSTWDAGDYITDTYRVTSNHRALPSGPYQLHVGLYTGTSPNFRNMPVSTSPANTADAQHRVKIATIEVR